MFCFYFTAENNTAEIQLRIFTNAIVTGGIGLVIFFCFFTHNLFE
jgi:hypothetical protein